MSRGRLNASPCYRLQAREAGRNLGPARLFWSPVMDEDDLPLDGFVGVVLAGGASQRMGSNKLLLDVVVGRAMVRHVVETVRGAVRRVVVVTGHQEERIREAL